MNLKITLLQILPVLPETDKFNSFFPLYPNTHTRTGNDNKAKTGLGYKQNEDLYVHLVCVHAE